MTSESEISPAQKNPLANLNLAESLEDRSHLLEASESDQGIPPDSHSVLASSVQSQTYFVYYFYPTRPYIPNLTYIIFINRLKHWCFNNFRLNNKCIIVVEFIQLC